MPASKEKKATEKAPAAVYFTSLSIRDVKCFKGEHTIDLSDGAGRPAQWTVILGNNNTGKTTLLKCLAGLEAVKISISEIEKEAKQTTEYIYPRNIQSDYTDFRKTGAELLTTLQLTAQTFRTNSFENYPKNWSLGSYLYGGGVGESGPPWLIEKLVIEAYGASRKMSPGGVTKENEKSRHTSLFQNTDLLNVEEWLLNVFLAKLQSPKEQKTKAQKIIGKAVEVLTSGLLPDVKGLRFSSKDTGQSFENYLEFETDFGWIRLRDLGYGYQTMLAWVLDLVRRMFERYPESKNPISEPAIVLVDEIDLHLHPEWQRKIIAHLTKYFPNTQFIVTAHSPLVVQSAGYVNIVLLEKEEDHVNINQPAIKTYKGWTIEEILTELMGLGEHIHSDAYLELIERFDNALDNDDAEAAHTAYNELDKILHPNSNQRKLLRLQMSSLTPA